MAESLQQTLAGFIRDLRRLPEIHGVVIVRRDGLVITSDLPDQVDPHKLAAMAAAIVGTGEMAAQELSQGNVSQSVVNCEGGRIICLGGGPEAILVALVGAQGNLGLALLQMEKAARRISEALVEVYAT